ncbi:MAG: flagellar basal body protein [Alphaproteobacteria bacterium]
MTISSAVSGLNAAAVRLNVAANNIANANTPDYKPQQAVQTATDDGVSVQVSTKDDSSGTSTDDQLVDAKIASYDYQANLRVIKTENDLQQSLLDVTA